MKTLAMSKLKLLVEVLDNLKLSEIDLNSDREVTRKDALSYLIPRLKKKKDRGHALSELASILTEYDLPITANALGRHLASVKESKKAAVGGEPADNPGMETARKILTPEADISINEADGGPDMSVDEERPRGDPAVIPAYLPGIDARA
jgi:hypothetical protein